MKACEETELLGSRNVNKTFSLNASSEVLPTNFCSHDAVEQYNRRLWITLLGDFCPSCYFFTYFGSTVSCLSAIPVVAYLRSVLVFTLGPLVALCNGRPTSFLKHSCRVFGERWSLWEHPKRIFRLLLNFRVRLIAP